MAKAILYYSNTGTAKKLAEKTANETGADLFEVSETKNRNGFTAFSPGIFQSVAQKRSAIKPLTSDLSAYDEFVIMGPIWASRPAPAVNSIIDLLPEGKTVSLICVSKDGSADLSKTAALVETKGCKVKETRCLKKAEV